MDLDAATVVLETLVFSIEQSVKFQDDRALILVIEFFKAVFAQGKEFALEVLQHLMEFFVETM